MLNLGEVFPNFVASSTVGELELYKYLGTSWGLLFSHPADFTPVCTTEMARMAQLSHEFVKRGVKVIGLSCDSVEDHKHWLEDVEDYSQCKVSFPLVEDPEGELANKIGLLEKGQDKKVTVRGVFVIDPEKKVKAIICYPTSTGRNLDEVLRLIDSLQLTAERKDVVTPVDWKVGGQVIIKPGAPSIVGQKAISLPSGREYLRFTD